ncbi:hypothetical protein DPMN_002877 [Dreissena polymorpha]|uniref:Uncharacterized protein n=1 Tax=Dreissena polymorpha TaxID=45954 RepID=A0A9D4MMF5_DREPO|nr:hypothetical protein DPMN_002877 [Dreissena polymorpha]
MNFSQPKHGKVPKRKARTAPDTDSDDDFDDEAALRALKRLCPNACVLTKDDSDTDTASDDEDMPPVGSTSLHIKKHTIYILIRFLSDCQAAGTFKRFRYIYLSDCAFKYLSHHH